MKKWWCVYDIIAGQLFPDVLYPWQVFELARKNDWGDKTQENGTPLVRQFGRRDTDWEVHYLAFDAVLVDRIRFDPELSERKIHTKRHYRPTFNAVTQIFPKCGRLI